MQCSWRRESSRSRRDRVAHDSLIASNQRRRFRRASFDVSVEARVRLCRRPDTKTEDIYWDDVQARRLPRWPSYSNDYQVKLWLLLTGGQIAPLERAQHDGVAIMPSGGFWGGVGEPTICVAAPVVLNAFFAATGKRLRRFRLRISESSWCRRSRCLTARGESHYSEHAAAAGKYVCPTRACDCRSSMRLVRAVRSSATSEARSTQSTKQGRRRP